MLLEYLVEGSSVSVIPCVPRLCHCISSSKAYIQQSALPDSCPYFTEHLQYGTLLIST